MAKTERQGRRRGYGATQHLKKKQGRPDWRPLQLAAAGNSDKLTVLPSSVDRTIQWARERKEAWGALDKDKILAFCDRWGVKVPLGPDSDSFWMLVHTGRARLADLWFYQRWYSKLWLLFMRTAGRLDNWTERSKGKRAAKRLAKGLP